MSHFQCAAALAAICCAAAASAAPVRYEIDPHHTYPSFEADHMGISVWRGKMNKSGGKVLYDKATGDGSVEVVIDLASIDFGNEPLNRWARGADFFNVKKNPKATYKGRFEGGANGTPARVVGELTLNGVTRPVALQVHSLKCIPHPLHKRELCGADASGSFQRDEFGLGAGKDWGFRMEVPLRIQVEAVAAQ